MSVMNTVRYGEQTYLYDIEGEQLLLSDLLYEGYREEKESCGEREREKGRERRGEIERERRGEGVELSLCCHYSFTTHRLLL